MVATVSPSASPDIFVSPLPASVLEDLLALVADGTPFSVNFEDITGFTFDAVEFSIPEPRRMHCSEFCTFAKKRQGKHRECVINKRLCNRRATRGRGFAGMCYLGMTERVEPLYIKGKTLGVFYFGGIAVKGEEAAAERKIRAYCRRRKLLPAPYLAAFRKVPKVTPEAWAAAQERFQRMVRLAAAYVESAALPLESYTMYGIRQDVTHGRKIGALSRSAMAYVRTRFTQTIQLASTAEALGCSSVHLSRTFKRELSIPFGEYVHRVRIGHAKLLLRTRALNATQVCYEVGFSDPSHFNRTFQRIVGQTPVEFVRGSTV